MVRSYVILRRLCSVPYYTTLNHFQAKTFELSQIEDNNLICGKNGGKKLEQNLSRARKRECSLFMTETVQSIWKILLNFTRS